MALNWGVSRRSTKKGRSFDRSFLCFKKRIFPAGAARKFSIFQDNAFKVNREA
jgi:hypothetical protein